MKTRTTVGWWGSTRIDGTVTEVGLADEEPTVEAEGSDVIYQTDAAFYEMTESSDLGYTEVKLARAAVVQS